MQLNIDLYQDNSERVPYNFPEMPVYARRGKLSHYPGYAAASHWHDDIEFVSVLSGSMDYNVDGALCTLPPGGGIFVNSRHLHYGFSSHRADCDFFCVLLHPILLCANSFVEQTFVAPITANQAFPYKLLSPEIAWEKEILIAVRNIYEIIDEKNAPLKIQSLFYAVWSRLSEHAPAPREKQDNESCQLTALKEMIGYIRQHYREKLTLAEIAAAGKVCKSNCCNLFQYYLHQTPIGHLTEYRLYQSTVLLCTTDRTVTEIGYAVGFSGASYYTETFRKWLGCIPTEYRKKQRTGGNCTR